ncbi:hypothetical protein RvY_07962 [Ramazzottius varieornatus]|uniref:G-protein coupled receptors family 1 profile domain-containing protein n=1 Tax=Ramazzottius varieornatus TaxID=947166 RepID=A0A1D1V488_RAMVA|nr:hypothetical protein RvY_07962 [Ramazzottius varieornatus]
MFVVTNNFTFDNITNSKYLKDNSTDDQYARLDEWWLRVTFCVLMSFLSFWGTIGNLFVIGSILIVKELRLFKHVFILNLGISDLLINSISMPFNILGALNSSAYWNGKGALCHFIATICVPGCSSSLFSIAAIAFERYLCICHQPLHRKLFTVRNCILMMITLWVLAHLIHLGNHVGWGSTYYDENYFLCWLDLRLWSYSFFYAVVSVLVPISFCFFAYFQIYLTIRRTKLSRSLITKKRADSATEHSAWVQEIMLVKTLFRLFVIFLLSWGPIAVLFCLNKAIDPPRWVNLIAIMMAHGNSATNSVVYYWMNGHWGTTVKSAKSHMERAGYFSPNSVAPETRARSKGPANTDSAENQPVNNRQPEKSVVYQGGNRGKVTIIDRP